MELSRRCWLYLIALLRPSLGQPSTPDRTKAVPVASTRLQLTAEVTPATTRLGGRIFVNVKLRNISKKVVTMSDTEVDSDFRVTVADMFGNEPPRTERGQRLLPGRYVPLRQDTLDLEPGQEIRISVEITSIYRLEQTGTYYVRVSRVGVWTEIPEDNNRFAEAAYSNPVQFTVAP